MKYRVSVVIPTYRGAGSVTRVADELFAALNGFELELVLVNDCSPDDTHERVARWLAEHPDKAASTVYVRLNKNFGEHNAVMAGIAQTSGECVLVMDDDFQNPPEETPRMFQALIDGGFDVLYSRYAEKKHSGFRNWGSRMNDLAAVHILGKPRNLYLSSFKCFNRFIADEVLHYAGPFPYLDALILRATRNIGVLDVRHDERAEGDSGYTLKKLVGLWFNMFTGYSVAPLRISFLLGVGVSGLGALGAASVVLEKLVSPTAPTGWASLMTALLLFSGVQLLVLGLVGEYLGRLFVTVNKLPQYVVREVTAPGRAAKSTTPCAREA